MAECSAGARGGRCWCETARARQRWRAARTLTPASRSCSPAASWRAPQRPRRQCCSPPSCAADVSGARRAGRCSTGAGGCGVRDGARQRWRRRRRRGAQRAARSVQLAALIRTTSSRACSPAEPWRAPQRLRRQCGTRCCPPSCAARGGRRRRRAAGGCGTGAGGAGRVGGGGVRRRRCAAGRGARGDGGGWAQPRRQR
jgi:hypothetical protein